MKRKPRIMSMIDAISGGGGMVAYNIIKELPQYDHVIVTPGFIKSWSIGLPKLFADEQISVDVISAGPTHAKTMHKILNQKVMTYDPDIIVNHWWKSAQIQRLNKFGRTRKVFGRAKTVLVSHNNDPSPPGYDYYVSVSKHNAKYQVYANKGKQKSNHQVIYNGIDIDRFSSIPKRPNKDKFVIGRVSSLVKFKVPRDWIRFVNTFNIPNLECIIVGEGERRRQFQYDINKLGAQHKFKLPGEVPQLGNELPQALAGFDILCYVTEKTEAFSLAILEAMAAGIPIVTQNVGGTPEQVIHGQTGFLCSSRAEVKQYCEWLYNNPKQLLIMGQNARRRAQEQFTLKKMADQYDELFLRLLNE